MAHDAHLWISRLVNWHMAIQFREPQSGNPTRLAFALETTCGDRWQLLEQPFGDEADKTDRCDRGAANESCNDFWV